MNLEKPIILFLANRQGYFSREVLRGIVSMRPDGCDWDIWAMPLIHEKRHLVACCEKRKISGVIARGLSGELQNFLNEEGIPLVAIRGEDTGHEDISNGPHVDDEQIGAKAGREFQNLQLGYWGFIHWEGVAWSEARRRSLQNYADKQGARNNTLSLSLEERHGWDGMLKIINWIEGLSKPCGVLACNDEAGLDVLHACQLAGLKVPEQVCVIGVDNDRLLCESSIPPLSSIDLHAEDVGKAAAKQLRGLMNGDAIKELHVSQISTVVRESSHEIDRYLLIYQRAVDFISTHAVTGVSVKDVAIGCATSRRGLERAFEKYSTETPAGLIRGERIRAILILLKNQPLSLERLAEQTGFSDSAGFSNFVKRMTGKPPGAFR